MYPCKREAGKFVDTQRRRQYEGRRESYLKILASKTGACKHKPRNADSHQKVRDMR